MTGHAKAVHNATHIPSAFSRNKDHSKTSLWLIQWKAHLSCSGTEVRPPCSVHQEGFQRPEATNWLHHTTHPPPPPKIHTRARAPRSSLTVRSDAIVRLKKTTTKKTTTRNTLGHEAKKHVPPTCRLFKYVHLIKKIWWWIFTFFIYDYL